MTRSNPIQFSTGQRVTLPFRARWAYIDNPTGNTVLVREGNTDQPATLAEADWWVPALGARVMPCNASEFGLGVGAPFSVAQAGLPTVALVVFGDESEPMPSIGSEAALSTVVSGLVTSVPPKSSLLDIRPFAGAGAKSYTVSLPAGTTGVLLYIASNTHGLFSDLTVVGADELLYFGGKTAPLSDELPIYMPIPIPINSPNESALTIAFTYNSATGSSWLLYALAGDTPPTIGAGGAQIVRENPAPLVFSGNSSTASPAAGTVIVDSGALPAGDYRVEAEIAGSGAAGNAKIIQLDGGGQTSVQPVGFGALRVEWTRVSIAASGHIIAHAFGTWAAGETAYASLRVYRIA